MEIFGETVQNVWRNAVEKILKHGIRFMDDNRGDCFQLSNLMVTIQKPSSIADAVRTLQRYKRWIYPSEEELVNIILNKEANAFYDYLYGQRIFDYRHTVNQIDEYVIPLLRKNPNSRRANVSLFNPEKDMRIGKRNYPGIAFISFKIIEKRLCVTTIIRTSDFFIGWPSNLFQISKLQEYVAHTLAVPPGTITTLSLSAHLHLDNIEDIKNVLGIKYPSKYRNSM